MVAVIELIPRPFTPTVIVDGKAQTDDVVDTRLLERLLSVHCPDLEADIVSAGYRVGKTAAADVVSLYENVIGKDPAPASPADLGHAACRPAADPQVGSAA